MSVTWTARRNGYKLKSTTDTINLYERELHAAQQFTNETLNVQMAAVCHENATVSSEISNNAKEEIKKMQRNEEY